MIKVAVAGALGRMGKVACAAIQRADDIELVGGLVRNAGMREDVVVPSEVEGEQTLLFEKLEDLIEQTKPDVLLDVTTYPATVEISTKAVTLGVRPVIGATGWSDFDRQALAARVEEHALGAMLVPNFSIGVALMVRFASEAARFFPSVEIIELHHDQKKDAPSGTARLAAERIRAAGYEKEVPIHSVRLRGLVAHHEVLFGGDGEVLTIRHDTLSRDSFAVGMLAAVRAVTQLQGLVVGLDTVLLEAES